MPSRTNLPENKKYHLCFIVIWIHSLPKWRVKSEKLANNDFSRNIFWWIIPPELLRQKQFKIWKSFIMPKAACLNKCCCCFRTPWRKKLQPFWQQRPLAFLLCPYILLCKAMCIFFSYRSVNMTDLFFFRNYLSKP